MTARGLAAAALLTVAFMLIYVPDVGHGFIRDDFMWVRAGRLTALSDVPRIFAANTGFYRPVVTLSFAADRLLFGLRPLPYALTNVALLFACAALVGRLARVLGLGWCAAGMAAALWAFNFHGINMALLWISGRTALLLCLFGLMTAIAAARHRWWQAGAWWLLALLSKEEAIALPFLLAWWSWYSADGRTRRLRPAAVAAAAMPMFLAVLLYAVLRWHSGAFGPADAPPYYRLTFAPAAVLRNALEYTDRAASFSVLVLLALFGAVRSRPSLADTDRRIAMFALAWLVTGFAVTLFLPLRSSLYVLFPSIGVALAGGLLAQRLGEAAPARMRAALLVLPIVPFLLLPIYRERNRRWVVPADASHTIAGDLRALAPRLTAGAHVVAVDPGNEATGLDSVFSGLFADAVTLYVGDGIVGDVVDPARAAQLRGNRDVEVLELRPDGHLAPASPAARPR